MKRYLLSLDQGSTSSRAMVFDDQGRIHARAQVGLSTLLPKPDWVEHSPKQLLNSQLSAIQQVLRQLGSDKKRLVALGIANQRSTVLLWDRKTGRPVSPAISWQDRRTSKFCRSLARLSPPKADPSGKSSIADLIRQRTGLRLTPYYAAPKLAWLLEHTQGARKRAEKGDLLCGTVNSYLIWNLTGGRAHITDHTNAARMLLMDLSTLNWDQDLLDLFGIPRQMLPRIVPTCDYLGEAEIGKERIPIFCSIGDQQAASIGLGCVEKGSLTLNYGTGGFLLLNTGSQRQSLSGLLTSIAWSSPKRINYLLEGTVNSVGSALDWLREGLGLFKDVREIPLLHSKSRHRVFVIPSLAGLGAPHWRDDVPTLFFNLNRQTRHADLVRGMIEGIAFLMKDILEAMKPAGLTRSGYFRAGGGIANLDALLQFQADLFQAPIERPVVLEATSQGAAFLAGLGYGIWSDPLQIHELVRRGRVFRPRMAKQKAEALYQQWRKLIGLALQWSAN
ncbi:MAG: FGGY family carbohydrate kinase [Nitrospiria bacterium]